MAFTPTPQQQAIADEFLTGDNLSIEAGAGAGKTSVLKLLAGLVPDRRGIYFAYNRSVANEAKASFPRNTLCNTGHGLAFKPTVDEAMRRRIFDMPRQSGREQAKILRINDPARINPLVMLAPGQIARLVLETVTRFMNSGDTSIERWHVARQTGVDLPADRRLLARLVIPLAQRAWEDMCSPTGRLKLTHDFYVKKFQLSGATLGSDFLFLDEAQDSNGVTMAIVRTQQDAGSQIVAVGDRQQAIYGWRGAVDAMDAFGGRRMLLSQSFRFGPVVADEANKWLELLEADLRITGNPALDTRVGTMERPDAILCRGNAEAVAQVMALQVAGVPVSLVGGGDQIRRLAEAAEQLKESGTTWHPELCAFTSWGQVQQYVEDDFGGGDLRTFVRLIDDYGTPAVVRAMDGLADERRAAVTVSTAHKAKGREWGQVRVADDFQRPKPDDDGRCVPARDEAMLAYVTVTRAQGVLDRGSLAYVDELMPAFRSPAPALDPATALDPDQRAALYDAVERVLTTGEALCGAKHPKYLKVACTLTGAHDTHRDTVNDTAGVAIWPNVAALATA